ncbi:MAG: hypothetical protein ACOZNI_29380 [Myxococcota bacterium]
MRWGGLGLALGACLVASAQGTPEAPPATGAVPLVGDPARLRASWSAWETPAIPVGDGVVTLAGDRIAATGTGTLWLVDQAPDRPVSISPSDRFVRLGELPLATALPAELDPDALVVTHAGESPLDAAHVAHVPLFTRLAHETRAPRPARRRVIRLAVAAEPDLHGLVVAGERAFATACSGCHAPVAPESSPAALRGRIMAHELGGLTEVELDGIEALLLSLPPASSFAPRDPNVAAGLAVWGACAGCHDHADAPGLARAARAGEVHDDADLSPTRRAQVGMLFAVVEALRLVREADAYVAIAASGNAVRRVDEAANRLQLAGVHGDAVFELRAASRAIGEADVAEARRRLREATRVLGGT